MAKFSREKGRRGEQQLVLHLAKLGYKAERILRQYQEAGQPDVKAYKPYKPDEVLTFENKSYRCSFKTIYDLYNKEKDINGVMSFALDEYGTAVAVSTSLEALRTPSRVFCNLSKLPEKSKDLRVYLRILRLKEIKQSADYLVLKDNNKPRLFLRYWG